MITDAHARYFGIAGERSKPHPGDQPAPRPDAFRGLAQPQQLNMRCLPRTPPVAYLCLVRPTTEMQ